MKSSKKPTLFPIIETEETSEAEAAADARAKGRVKAQDVSHPVQLPEVNASFKKLFKEIREQKEVDWQSARNLTILKATFTNRIHNISDDDRLILANFMFQKGAPYNAAANSKAKGLTICDAVRHRKDTSTAAKLLLLIESLFKAFEGKDYRQLEGALENIIQQTAKDRLLQVCAEYMKFWKNKESKTLEEVALANGSLTLLMRFQARLDQMKTSEVERKGVPQRYVIEAPDTDIAASEATTTRFPAFKKR